MFNQDQIIHTFFFTFTPLLIEELHPQRIKAEKTILIKLGNFQVKMKEIGQPYELMIPMVYSDHLQKYGITRGLIKMYDICKDGSETIRSVGALTTDELLNVNNPQNKIVKSLGQLRFTFSCTYHKYQSIKQISPNKSLVGKENDRNQQNLHLSSKLVKDYDEEQNQGSPLILDDSAVIMHKWENFPSSHSSYFEEDIKRQELELVGEQLIQERRKVSILQQKLGQSSLKKSNFKKSLAEKKQEIKDYLFHFKKLIGNLQTDSRGNYKLQINEISKQISLNFKEGVNIQQQFTAFLLFLTKKLKQNQMKLCPKTIRSSNNTDEDDDSEEKRVRISQLEQKVSQGVRKMNLAEKMILEMESQKKQHLQIIKNYEEALTIKNELIRKLEDKIKKLTFKKMALSNMSTYFKQKNQEMECFFNQKQEDIGCMCKILGISAQELDALQFRNQKLKQIVKNLEYTIQQMKEENQNLMETVEVYREKFGDLKASKDKILELKLKECIQWIESQSKSYFLNHEESSILSEDTSYGLISAIRNTQNIAKYSSQKLKNLRKQAAELLKKIDEVDTKTLQ